MLDSTHTKSDYSIALERGDLNYPELEHLYRSHYAEMQERLRKDGVEIGDYAPRLKQYFAAFEGGWLLNFVVRIDGAAVGYSNVYITNDMHNGEKIAQEDTVFITKAHRNGIGRRLVKTILAHLKKEGVVRATITPMTDLRAKNLWNRMGFKEVSTQMVYTFKEH